MGIRNRKEERGGGSRRQTVKSTSEDENLSVVREVWLAVWIMYKICICIYMLSKQNKKSGEKREVIKKRNACSEPRHTYILGNGRSREGGGITSRPKIGGCMWREEPDDHQKKKKRKGPEWEAENHLVTKAKTKKNPEPNRDVLEEGGVEKERGRGRESKEGI